MRSSSRARAGEVMFTWRKRDPKSEDAGRAVERGEGGGEGGKKEEDAGGVAG